VTISDAETWWFCVGTVSGQCSSDAVLVVNQELVHFIFDGSDAGNY
jgi:hypothetical protein